LADLGLYGTNQPTPWAFKMNRTERYEGTDAQVYSIEFQSDRYVVHAAGRVFLNGRIPGNRSSHPSGEQAALIFAVQEIEKKIKALQNAASKS
jgi:hypothetical protein